MNISYATEMIIKQYPNIYTKILSVGIITNNVGVGAHDDPLIGAHDDPQPKKAAQAAFFFCILQFIAVFIVIPVTAM